MFRRGWRAVVHKYRPWTEGNGTGYPDQAQKLAFSSTFVDTTNDPSARLTAKLSDLAPGDLARVHFATGGSTAIDSAYRLVQFYQSAIGRPEEVQIIARDDSYHGGTYAA